MKCELLESTIASQPQFKQLGGQGNATLSAWLTCKLCEQSQLGTGAVGLAVSEPEGVHGESDHEGAVVGPDDGTADPILVRQLCKLKLAKRDSTAA